VHSIKKLYSLLMIADIVVVAVPLTDETEELVNEEFLAAMKDNALLVNISRGRVASTDALIKEASSGRLRLALDVTDPEPLPDGHVLFSLENVLISPHVGGASSAMLPRMAQLIAAQISQMAKKQNPLNVVLRS